MSLGLLVLVGVVLFTAGSSPNTMPDQFLRPGEQLKPNDRITSSNGLYTLIMQGDGNLVLYLCEKVALWHSQTCGVQDPICLMQPDGNLVIYGTVNGVRKAVWASNTSGFKGSRLICQNDGNLVLYHGNKAIWATMTVEDAKLARQYLRGFAQFFKDPHDILGRIDGTPQGFGNQFGNR